MLVRGGCLLLLLWCSRPFRLAAQTPTVRWLTQSWQLGREPTDTLRRSADAPRPRFTARPAFRRTIVPATLLTLAVLGTEKVDVLESDEELREEVHEHLRIRTNLDDQLRHVPAYASLGLSLVGVKGKHNTLNQALLFGLTYTINNALTSNLKRLTHVERPLGNSFDSFPSQHTSAAFSAATFLHKEYGGRSIWYSVGGYTVATATGGLRIAKDNHWLSDVMAGAAVGIVSTELAYWAYPWLHRQLRKGLGDRAVVIPSYLNGAAGATVVVML
nr:phosphatase PAP2 family protein [Hymenobacter sp. 15J16-1T3B]